MTSEQANAELMLARLLRIPLKASEIENSSITYSDVTGKGWRWIAYREEPVTDVRIFPHEFLYICDVLCPKDTFSDHLLRIDSALLLCKRGLLALRPKSIRLFPGPIQSLYRQLKSDEIPRLAHAPLKNPRSKTAFR